MKEPRFVREFRSYVVLKIYNSDKPDSVKRILNDMADRAVDNVRKGLITTDEAMRLLIDVLDFANGRKSWGE